MITILILTTVVLVVMMIILNNALSREAGSAVTARFAARSQLAYSVGCHTIAYIVLVLYIKAQATAKGTSMQRGVIYTMIACLMTYWRARVWTHGYEQSMGISNMILFAIPSKGKFLVSWKAGHETRARRSVGS